MVYAFILSLKKFVLFILAFCLLCLGVFVCVRKVERKIYPLNYKEQVWEYSIRFSVSCELILATVKVESDFDKDAVSSKGAIGLMQITQNTANYIALMLNESDYDLTDPDVNLRFGTFYLKYLLERFESVETAVCAYNAGEGNVSAWLKNKEYSADGVTLSSIPFKETRVYLEKIKKTFRKYKKLYGNILDK